MWYGPKRTLTARAVVGAGEQFSEEAVIRLPNVLIGALTVIPLFLLTTAFFDLTAVEVFVNESG